MVAGAPSRPPPQEPTTTKGIKVAIHLEYLKQTVTIGESLSKKGRMELCNLLKENLDIFSGNLADMTGVPRGSIPGPRGRHERNQDLSRESRSDDEATIPLDVERSEKPQRKTGKFKQ
nr:reverse transcriptase domain-containing protein [Tanacetum cinerariifolium]